MAETTTAVLSEVAAPAALDTVVTEEAKEMTLDTPENGISEEAEKMTSDPVENGVAEEQVNGVTTENGHTEEVKVNGHGENGHTENGDTEIEPDEAESEEPAVKKIRKTPKAKDLKSANRRSSSRLVNLDSGNKLSAEITSDNLKNLK